MTSRSHVVRAAAVALLLSVGALLAVAGRDPGPGILPAPPTDAPAPSMQAAREWRFARSALVPTDPNVVGPDLRAALPLPDGGWLLSVDARASRCLAFDSWSCHVLVKSGTTIVRLDADGAVVGERKDALAIYAGEVFATRHVAVVSNGSLYAVDIDTLATVATLPDPNIRMTRSGERLFTWETYRRAAGATDLVERDPATLSELARYPHLTLDGLFDDVVVIPEHNAIAYSESVGAGRFAVRILPLDPTRPADVPWLAGACGVGRVAEGRVAVSRGATCTNDEERGFELRSTADGRILASAPHAYESRWGASVLLVDGDRLIDPITGAHIPDVPGWPVAVADSRAITRLGDGGLALLRLDGTRAAVVGAPTVVAQAVCPWPDFAHVAVARSENIRCPELVAAAGAKRLVISLGRQPTATSLTVDSVEIDAGRRVLTVQYTQSTSSPYAGPTAQVAILDLPDMATGEWLVWLVPAGARSGYSTGPAFSVRLP